MIFKWLTNIIGDTDEKRIKQYQPLIDKINSFEDAIKKLSDEELRQKTDQFRSHLKKGKKLDDILPEAFATVRETSVRTIGLRHFDVQLIGGLVLHQGKIAEMKTGEGKTLAATLAVYLNALDGRGVHLITVNDYLAKRDAEWMAPIYQALGLTVGFIQHNMDYQQRKHAYSCDVTYGTNNEFGFDYLRDNMSLSIEQCVQRELNYAIVDEVDSILVDEARTPLIISGVVEDTLENFSKADQLARKLNKTEDFTSEEKSKNIALTEAGIKKIEKWLNIEYLFDIQTMSLAHQILQALKAHHMFKRDTDYVIKDNEVIIVDEFTGRLMVGRRYSDGLHQAIEAKEGVRIQEESQTLATITFQNYFRLYNKLSGMTGTAKTEEGEFYKIYGLEVFVVPTHKPMIRQDNADVIYKDQNQKFKAVVNEIAELYKKGRPLLVGTISIENSEVLSELLKRRGVPHNVLNAKQHEREAEIISQAGQKGRVTISTNMAGRGTDIVLGEGVKELGGLHVIGTERHESRRIDNQLRGRSGRQGDGGSSRFYVALDDSLMRLFGSDRIAGIMGRLGMSDDTPIEHNMISRALENAQKKVEQYHFGIRKQVLEYDDVMNKQRDTIYTLRRRILEGKKLKEKIFEMMENTLDLYLDSFLPDKTDPEQWDHQGFFSAINDIIKVEGIELLKDEKKREAVREEIFKTLKDSYEEREKDLGEQQIREIERLVMLRVLDTKWIEQLHNMDLLREGIGLRGIGGRDPLVEYKMEGYHMFQDMMMAAREEICKMIFKVQLVRADETPQPMARGVRYGGPAKESQPEPAKRTGKKVGRNDPCPCGSGKKYKKCCGV